MADFEKHNQAPEGKDEKPSNSLDGADAGQRAGLEDKYPEDMEANDGYEENAENKAAYWKMVKELQNRYRNLGVGDGVKNDMGAHQGEVQVFTKGQRKLFTIQVDKQYRIFQLDDHTLGDEEDVKFIFKDPDRLMEEVENIIDRTDMS